MGEMPYYLLLPMSAAREAEMEEYVRRDDHSAHYILRQGEGG